MSHDRNRHGNRNHDGIRQYLAMRVISRVRSETQGCERCSEARRGVDCWSRFWPLDIGHSKDVSMRSWLSPVFCRTHAGVSRRGSCPVWSGSRERWHYPGSNELEGPQLCASRSCHATRASREEDRKRRGTSERTLLRWWVLVEECWQVQFTMVREAESDSLPQ